VLTILGVIGYFGLMYLDMDKSKVGTVGGVTFGPYNVICDVNDEKCPFNTNTINIEK